MVNVFGNMLIACMGITFALGIMPSVARATSAARMLLSVILRKPQQTSGNFKLEIIKGEVEFKDVRFEYPTRPGHPVLRDFNLKITPGQKVALVGKSLENQMDTQTGNRTIWWRKIYCFSTC